MCSDVRALEETGPIDETAAQCDRTPRDFESVVVAEYPRLVATAQFLVGSSHVAEELVQDCLARSFRRWDEVSRLDRPGAWLRRTVINASMSSLRRSRTERRAVRRLGLQRRIPDTEPDLERFSALVASLPEQMSRALALRYGADLSVRAVALELSISESAARTVLFRARERLRADLVAAGELARAGSDTDREEAR